MKVVVTGATGNLGSACVRELTAGGRHEVVGVARRRPRVPRPSPLASVSWHPTDVATDDLDSVLAGADAVVHLAWKFQPTHRPAETWATNGTSEAAYCREKAYDERVLDAFEERSPDTRVVRLRPAFVFQRSAASEQRRIFGGALVRPRMLDRRVVPVLPVPSGLRMQAVHAGDVARAVLAAVERPVGGAFNLAADGVLRRRELGELMAAPTVEVPAALARGVADLGWHSRILPVPGSLLSALLSVPLLRTDRARDELGWVAHHTAGEAVGAMLEGAAMAAGSDLPPLRP